jgi:hypothetical protein
MTVHPPGAMLLTSTPAAVFCCVRSTAEELTHPSGTCAEKTSTEETTIALNKEDVVSAVRSMLETYPRDLGQIDRAKLIACIDACIECDQACTACADACLSEDLVNHLTKCIRTCLDCSDVCETTGRVLSRHTGYDANLTRTVLQTCATACKTSADECDKHAAKHEHCRVCADVCRRCERACRDLVEALG